MPKKISSDDRAIVRGMATVAALVLLGSVARAGREMAIAYRYGVSAEVDAYLFVFNLINWPLAVWFSVLTAVLVPLSARIRVQTPTELPAFRSELLGLALMIGAAIALASVWLLPTVLGSSWAGLPPRIAHDALAMVTPMSFLAPLGVLVGLFSVWTMAAGRHTNTLLESLPSLGILFAILILPYNSTVPLVGGTLAGFAAQGLALFLVLRYSREIEYPRFAMRSPHWAPFFSGFGIVLAGQVLMSLTTLVDQFFAGKLGAGNIATLNYANRILALVMGVAAMAVSRTTLPLFSQNQRRGNGHMVKLARRWVWRLFGMGTAVLALTWLVAPWIVKIFFERGAFTNQNTLAVVEVLRLCVLQIPFYVAGIVLTSYFASQGAYAALFWSSTLALLVKLAASATFTIWWGLNGLPLASAAMCMATFTLLLLTFERSTAKTPNEL